MMSLCQFHQHFFSHQEEYSVSGVTGYSGGGGGGGADGDGGGDGGYSEIFLVQVMKKIHGRSRVVATNAFSLCSICQKGHLHSGSNGRL